MKLLLFVCVLSAFVLGNPNYKSCCPPQAYKTKYLGSCMIQSDPIITPFDQFRSNVEFDQAGWYFILMADDMQVQVNIAYDAASKSYTASEVYYACLNNGATGSFTYAGLKGTNTLTTITCPDTNGQFLGSLSVIASVELTPHVQIQEVRYFGTLGRMGLCYFQNDCDTYALGSNGPYPNFKSSCPPGPTCSPAAYKRPYPGSCMIQTDPVITPFNQNMKNYYFSKEGWYYAVLAVDMEVQVQIVRVGTSHEYVVSTVAVRCSPNSPFTYYTYQSLLGKGLLKYSCGAAVGSVSLISSVEIQAHVQVQEVRYLGNHGLLGLCYGDDACDAIQLGPNGPTVNPAVIGNTAGLGTGIGGQSMVNTNTPVITTSGQTSSSSNVNVGGTTGQSSGANGLSTGVTAAVSIAVALAVSLFITLS